MEKSGWGKMEHFGANWNMWWEMWNKNLNICVHKEFQFVYYFIYFETHIPAN